MKSEDFLGVLDDDKESEIENRDNSLNYDRYTSIVSEEDFLITRSRIATVRLH